MKCKDCAVSRYERCPHCDKYVVICTEGDATILNGKWWEEDIGCDGILES